MDPARATVRDAWEDDASPSDRRVRLDFAVSGGNLRAAARVMTASELILLGGRVRTLMQAQREGAARESKVFASARASKPQNPLAQVATAVLENARSKMKETDELDLMVIQHMDLNIGNIRLGIFNETDTRMTQFEADVVHGELVRRVRARGKAPIRDLTLSLEAFEVRNGDVPSSVEKWLDFLAGAKVFTMPEMHITMNSTEFTNVNPVKLDYSFRSTFPRSAKARAGQRTLYIALDFHKYEQLVAMQSAFKDAIEKALVEIGSLPAQRPATRSAISVQPSTPATEETAGSGQSSAEKISGGTSTSQPTTPDAVPSAPGRSDSLEAVSAPTQEVVDLDHSTAPDLAVVKVGMRGVTYHCIERFIETPKLHQLGAASPDLETFKQWTNISIRDSLPVWIHEYATVPMEQLILVLMELYVKQLKKEDEATDEEDDALNGNAG